MSLCPFQKVFDDAMRFLKPTLKTQPVAIDESLISQVPAGREGRDQGARKGGGKRNKKAS